MSRFKSLFFVTVAVLAFGAVQAFSGSDKSKDIVDTAVDAGSFTTLVAAIQAAG
ncbi:MAG: fasciclin domain-containing protein, partial [Thermodesulfobacteriota bacterium]